jgi:hypothetical protein
MVIESANVGTAIPKVLILTPINVDMMNNFFGILYSFAIYINLARETKIGPRAFKLA